MISTDFSASGAPIVFGFWAGNTDSGTVINAYDNFVLTTMPVQAPEPATLVLLGLGIGVLGFTRRRKLP